jgi:hypothetical protein
MPPTVFDYIICTDEAYFYLHGSVNKQNDRFWLPERPKTCARSLCMMRKF